MNPARFIQLPAAFACIVATAFAETPPLDAVPVVPAFDRIVAEVSREAGVQRRSISDDEIRERLLYPMVNEGAKILEEGKAIRASDIDVIWVYGYGWPVYRGGPMFWADQIGLKTIRDRLLAFEKQTGSDFWRPAPLLNKLADQGRVLHLGSTRSAAGRPRRSCCWRKVVG